MYVGGYVAVVGGYQDGEKNLQNYLGICVERNYNYKTDFFMQAYKPEHLSVPQSDNQRHSA